MSLAWSLVGDEFGDASIRAFITTIFATNTDRLSKVTLYSSKSRFAVVSWSRSIHLSSAGGRYCSLVIDPECSSCLHLGAVDFHLRFDVLVHHERSHGMQHNSNDGMVDAKLVTDSQLARCYMSCRRTVGMLLRQMNRATCAIFL